MEHNNYVFIDEIYDFFNTPEKPLSWQEFSAFWMSLTPEEILELRNINTIS